MAAVRLDRIVLQVRGPQCKTVCFEYWMGGIHTGQLWLLLDHRQQHAAPVCKCSWRSNLTKLSTDWHGTWYLTEIGLCAIFDFRGQSDQKWTHVSHLDGTGSCTGEDYQRRGIRMQLKDVYTPSTRMRWPTSGIKVLLLDIILLRIKRT